jgi:acetyl-CoA C-acetyltransferase
MSISLKDRVAVVGMGCTRFGELWDRSPDDLIIDAAQQALESAGVPDAQAVDAFWYSTFSSASSGLPLARALKVHRPVTRVENMCAGASDAMRNAALAVASGVHDLVMVVGVEKLKDSGYAGLVVPEPPGDNTAPVLSAPAVYAMLPRDYADHYGVAYEDVRRAMTHIAWKNHANGAKNPDRAQFTYAVAKADIDAAPRVAGDLSVYDCSGVADGAAAALLVRAEDAPRYTDEPMYLKALSLHTGTSVGSMTADYSNAGFPEVAVCAANAYRQAGVTDPRREISLAEVHDCFTPTELILMEDLGFSARGAGWRDVLDGTYDLDGDLPVNPDGGLKSFGHPVGASGLRMMFELWLQFRGEAGQRQRPGVSLGLTQNMGGFPGAFVSFVSIFGKEPPS